MLITGASGKIGSYLARRLSKDYRLVLHYYSNVGRIRELLKSEEVLSSITSLIPYDFRKSVEGFIELLRSRVGEVDHAVLTASIYDETPLSSLRDAKVREILDINLSSQIALIAKLREVLKDGGRVVVLTDVISLRRDPSIYAPLKPSIPYVVSKIGLSEAIRLLGRELLPKVKVIGIALGWVDLPSLSSELRTRAKAKIPLKRLAMLEEIYELVKLILEGELDYASGSLVEFSGGL